MTTSAVQTINTWRVPINPPNYGSSNNEIRFFIETGVTSHPIVTIGDIAGFASITGDIIAKGMHWNDMDGIAVTIRFPSNPGAGGLQLNVFQPGLRAQSGNPTVSAM